ncbi:sulfite exporter TauE/SafE family protein [Defluviimonas sp. WL0050]|uniref:Probable membrane transporter protein n=1 Tax=Albidovulum litorale TaxID=2984134 RepID=A0ABT2ZMA1_9RHOB|nr:sulfite exporter TauE/SafE family protein [Defluviimonas sp. WL0050]MCV2872265.1 sulfite exporter TauE/SafE family protein [Defluviimonas sp. WL0050]
MFGLDLTILLMALAVTVFASIVKGAVGFAMPMIMISGLASFLPAEQALAALILPTLGTNLAQALRQGWRAALATTLEYRRLLITLCITIAIAAQLVPVMPQAVMLMTLGLPIVVFALTQLAGWQMRFEARNRGRAEVTTGLVGGFFGGISGVWGPPTIALLISLDVEKRENVRVQGVVYMIGSAMLLAAHLGSGVVNGQTLPLSAALTLPAMAGLYAGFAIQDRLDQRRFRRWTLIVLAITGLNLVRRALTL